MGQSTGELNKKSLATKLSNVRDKMSSSFSNSFDSEIVLLGGSEKQHRPGKHSRVGTLTSVKIENEEDLNIEDSVSVRSLTSYSVISGENLKK